MSFLSARTKAGLTQAAAAKALGVTDAAVCYWENGKYFPRGALLVKISSLYNCTVDELLAPEQEAGGDSG